MKPLKKILAATLMICAVVLISSCKKDDPEQPEKEYTMEDIIVPLTWDRFLKADDVIIEKNDTSSLLISTQFLNEVVKKEIVPGLSYLAIWLKPDQYPFYRLVVGIGDEGDRQRLTVEPADVSCCIPDGEHSFNTDLYRNVMEEPRIGGSGGPINSDYYFDPVNRDYHPVAVFFDSTGQMPLDENDEVEINFKSLPSPLVEDYFSQFDSYVDPENWTINPSLTISFTTKDKYFGKEDSSAKNGLKRAAVKATAGFKLTVDVGVQMKKKKIGFVPIYYPDPYVKEFAVSGNYGFSADYEAISQMRGEKKFGDDYPLFKTSGINTVFMLGPIPLLISADPEFIFRCKGSVTGGIGVSNIGKMEANREQGIQYKGGKWKPIDNKKPFKAEMKTGFDVDGTLSGQLGLFLKVPLKIDKLAGPYLAVGGQIEAKADGRVFFEIPRKSEWPTVDFKATIDMWAGAEFGAEIKFMKWKLTSPKVEFKLLQENLLTWPEKKSVSSQGLLLPLETSYCTSRAYM